MIHTKIPSIKHTPAFDETDRNLYQATLKRIEEVTDYRLIDISNYGAKLDVRIDGEYRTLTKKKIRWEDLVALFFGHSTYFNPEVKKAKKHELMKHGQVLVDRPHPVDETETNNDTNDSHNPTALWTNDFRSKD